MESAGHGVVDWVLKILSTFQIDEILLIAPNEEKAERKGQEGYDENDHEIADVIHDNKNYVHIWSDLINKLHEVEHLEDQEEAQKRLDDSLVHYPGMGHDHNGYANIQSIYDNVDNTPNPLHNFQAQVIGLLEEDKEIDEVH